MSTSGSCAMPSQPRARRQRPRRSVSASRRWFAAGRTSGSGLSVDPSQRHRTLRDAVSEPRRPNIPPHERPGRHLCVDSVPGEPRAVCDPAGRAPEPGRSQGHDFVYGELLIGDRGGRKELLANYGRPIRHSRPSRPNWGSPTSKREFGELTRIEARPQKLGARLDAHRRTFPCYRRYRCYRRHSKLAASSGSPWPR